MLIVGSSMVGMSLAVFLASQGIKSLACERHASTAIHPRAAFFISRTLEIYRAFGLMKTMLTESEKFASPVSLLIYLDITTLMPES